MEVQQDRPTVEQLRQRVLAHLNQDPNTLPRLLGPALPAALDSRDQGVVG